MTHKISYSPQGQLRDLGYAGLCYLLGSYETSTISRRSRAWQIS